MNFFKKILRIPYVEEFWSFGNRSFYGIIEGRRKYNLQIRKEEDRTYYFLEECYETEKISGRMVFIGLLGKIGLLENVDGTNKLIEESNSYKTRELRKKFEKFRKYI